MVEFLDPLTNETISYHLDEKLLNKWNTLRAGKLEAIYEDKLYIVDGREGHGKSTFAFQQAKYLDPNFSVDKICFTPDDFVTLLKTAPIGSAVVFDEAFRGLSSKSSRSDVNKKIVEALMESRQRSLKIFIVMPTIFLLETYPAVFRSEALFHVYKLKNEKGTARAFKIYNYRKKVELYLRGKAKFFSYARPRITMAKGKFLPKVIERNKPWVPYKTFPMEAYLQKKHEAFVKKKEEKGEEQNKWLIQRNIIIKGLMRDFFKSQTKLSMWLDSVGMPISRTMIGEILGNSVENEGNGNQQPDNLYRNND